MPQWRGRLRDGGARAFVEPASWPDALKRGWGVEVGEGYSSPLIVGSTVFVFSRQDGREVLRALDIATGAERWQAGYAASYTPSPPTIVHGYRTQGDTTRARRQGVHTRDQWHPGRVRRPDRQAALASAKTPLGENLIFSAASSPLGVPGLVIVHPGNYEALTAFDVSSGAVEWKTGAGGFFMSPTLATLRGVPQVISVTQAGVMSVTPSDGHLLWEYPVARRQAGRRRADLTGDQVIVSAGGSGVTALRPSLRGGTWTVEKVWETADAEMYLSHPVVVDETLYGFSTKARGQLFALDMRDGHTRWLGPPRQATNVAVTKAGNFLLLLEDDGELIVAWANNNAFDPVKTLHAWGEGATWAQPVVSGRRILIRDGNALTMWTLD